MNLMSTPPAPAMGRVDAQGLLVDAEHRLADLNSRAGGATGKPIAIPQLAALVRLAQRLGIPIARSIIAADGEDDLELWVRAEPDPMGVRIEVSGWRAQSPWQSSGGDAARDSDFFRTAADWTWETDAALRIVHLSSAAGFRYGFDAQAMLGQPLTKLFALADDGEGGFPILAAVAAQRRFEGQLATLRSTGQKVKLAATPRTDPAARFAGFIGSTEMLDVPAAAPVEGGADSPDPVEAGARFVGGFGERLNRALSSPLQRIIAHADSISAQSEGPLRADYADYAADIAGAGRHLLGLVQDLVDLQTIESPDFAVSADPIDLAEAVRQAAGLLSVRAAAAEVKLDRPDSEDTLPATGDFRRVLQILVNLIGNAVRYSPKGGMVWLRIEREGDMGCVIVADQGKGIAQADQARIFEKFERVDASEPGGSGLGLYIARTLARAMGGDVTVDSAPGQGARFILTLPARD